MFLAFDLTFSEAIKEMNKLPRGVDLRPVPRSTEQPVECRRFVRPDIHLVRTKSIKEALLLIDWLFREFIRHPVCLLNALVINRPSHYEIQERVSIPADGNVASDVTCLSEPLGSDACPYVSSQKNLQSD